MTYDFSSLAPADFEDLVRDLIGLECAMRFEAFDISKYVLDVGVYTRRILAASSEVRPRAAYAAFPSIPKATTALPQSVTRRVTE